MPKLNVLVFSLLSSVVLILFSCKNEQPCGACPDIQAPVCGSDGITYNNECEALCAGQSIVDGFCEEEADAMVVDTGPIVADGCGYMILIGKDLFYPNELDSTFFGHQIPVFLRFQRTLHLYHCGFNPFPYPVLDIIEIEAL